MKNNSRLIYALALTKMILPYLLQSAYYEPHRDEFLYLAEGQHLAWGYMEVPPLLSIFAWLTHLFGNSIFWIKFWPGLFGSLTFILCGKVVSQLGGSRFAIWLAFLPFIFSAWLRMFFLFQPNAPEIFFSTLMAYAVFQYIRTSKYRWLYVLGIATGLGLLSKYSVAFWAVSLGLGLALSSQRKIFLNKHLYIPMVLAFLMFLPNLLWQFNHGWPVFQHMKELKETQLQYMNVPDFFIGQFMMYLPVFFIWITSFIYCFKLERGKFRVFALAFVMLQIIMIYFQGKAYYTSLSFPFLFAFGAVALAGFATRMSAIFKWIFIAFSTVVGILSWPLLLPVFKPDKLADYYSKYHFEKTGLLKWEDLRDHELPQDFADMLGWKELAEKTADAWHTFSDEEKKNAMIWAGNYGEAGALNYYRTQYEMPESYSENASFLFWYNGQSFPENTILIEKNRDVLNDPILKEFERVEVMDSVTNKYAVERGTLILKLQRPSAKVQEYFIKKIRDKKKKFRVE